MCTEAEFHLENTLLNGQCFNWWKVPTRPSQYEGVFRSYVVRLERETPDDVSVVVEPRPADEKLFEKEFRAYLNLDQSVTKLYEEWSRRDPEFFAKIATPMIGIRCLRQDPFECTMSFICSQNNNIKRIFQLVATLRNSFGDPISPGVHKFPTLGQLQAKATDKKLRDLGFGYRAPYIIKSC